MMRRQPVDGTRRKTQAISRLCIIVCLEFGLSIPLLDPLLQWSKT